MSFTFNGPNKLIILTTGTTSFDVKNLYSSWKTWISSGDNSKYQPAFKTIGGDPVSSTSNVSPYYFISNDWRIRPYESNHNLNIDGNLFVDGGTGNPFVNTTGNYNVMINLSTSTNAVLLQNATITTINSTTNTINKKIDDLTALSL